MSQKNKKLLKGCWKILETSRDKILLLFLKSAAIYVENLRHVNGLAVAFVDVRKILTNLSCASQRLRSMISFLQIFWCPIFID